MGLPEGSKTAGRVYAKCIMDFENRIKRDFRNNGQKWAVEVGMEEFFPKAGIEEGYMVFNNEEILMCFEPVVNRILELTRNQIIAIQAQNRSVKVSMCPSASVGKDFLMQPLQNTIITGPLGGNEYLYHQIRLHLPVDAQRMLVRPMDMEGAVARGAVIAGVDRHFASLKTSIVRHTYLIQILVDFITGIHSERHRMQCLDGRDRCKDIARVIVRKGQVLDEQTHFRVAITKLLAPGDPLVFHDTLYTYPQMTNEDYISIRDSPHLDEFGKCLLHASLTANLTAGTS